MFFVVVVVAFWLLAFLHVRRLVLGGFLSQGHIRSFSSLEEHHSVIHFGLFVGFLKTSYRHPGHFNFSQACSVSCSVPFLHSRDFKASFTSLSVLCPFFAGLHSILHLIFFVLCPLSLSRDYIASSLSLSVIYCSRGTSKRLPSRFLFFVCS